MHFHHRMPLIANIRFIPGFNEPSAIKTPSYQSKTTWWFGYIKQASWFDDKAQCFADHRSALAYRRRLVVLEKGH